MQFKLLSFFLLASSYFAAPIAAPGSVSVVKRDSIDDAVNGIETDD
jgi:hypothetical protein